ncbi:hypothetical protein GJV26_07750 [Massilia dura]|uniref:Uncharacterized protein n=1 Tax=Pseudoduganella dura TaxID=321982 RepID=A0A6I3XCU5_9BURK|nr:hypothetical protein [Pseudoduganella dura]MUI12360.1 hypothetical protein [Pseudoduganella dura]GGX99732.1 hypothetical protein GCM10007386_33240 [Pseudoduganella dura]
MTVVNAMNSKARLDLLTAQHVVVGLIFQEMLSTPEADAYLQTANVPGHVVSRVLFSAHKRKCDPDRRSLQENTDTAEQTISVLNDRRSARRRPDLHYDCRRKNYLLAAYVNAALRSGYPRAEKILANENAPQELIDRVRNRLLGIITDAPVAALRHYG